MYVPTHGISKWCVECAKARRAETIKDYRERNAEKLKEASREHNRRRSKNPEYAVKKAQWARDRARRLSSDPRRRLDKRMSQLVRNALNGTKNGRTWESLVGYSIADLMAHLERQFSRGMSWANMGEWHVDHILPKSMFRYVKPGDEGFAACWALTNLRPLWSGENIKKSSKRLFLI